MIRIVMILFLFILGCSDDNEGFVYYGRLDADIIRVSSEVGEVIDSLSVDEGMAVRKGQILAWINTKKLFTRREQQVAQLAELEQNILAMSAQIKQISTELDFAEKNLARTKRMLESGAATENRLDELQTQVDVLKARIEAVKRQRSALIFKQSQLEEGIKLTDLSINDSKITAPFDGTVINRFHLRGELVSPGTPLFEIADLTKMEAKIYVPLQDLNTIKLGQSVNVKVDGVERPFEGKVRWIASQSEFTPKTILTKETRTTLVYQVKIHVPNYDSRLKIGMPVDVEL